MVLAGGGRDVRNKEPPAMPGARQLYNSFLDSAEFYNSKKCCFLYALGTEVLLA